MRGRFVGLSYEPSPHFDYRTIYHFITGSIRLQTRLKQKYETVQNDVHTRLRQDFATVQQDIIQTRLKQKYAT